MLGPAIRFQTQARDHTDALPAKKRAVDLASHFRSGDVRFGSKADMCSALGDVRFTPNSGHMHRTSPCLLWAKSGHLGVKYVTHPLTMSG